MRAARSLLSIHRQDRRLFSISSKAVHKPKRSTPKQTPAAPKPPIQTPRSQPPSPPPADSASELAAYAGGQLFTGFDASVLLRGKPLLWGFFERLTVNELVETKRMYSKASVPVEFVESEAYPTEEELANRPPTTPQGLWIEYYLGGMGQTPESFGSMAIDHYAKLVRLFNEDALATAHIARSTSDSRKWNKDVAEAVPPFDTDERLITGSLRQSMHTLLANWARTHVYPEVQRDPNVTVRAEVLCCLSLPPVADLGRFAHMYVQQVKKAMADGEKPQQPPQPSYEPGSPRPVATMLTFPTFLDSWMEGAQQQGGASDLVIDVLVTTRERTLEHQIFEGSAASSAAKPSSTPRPSQADGDLEGAPDFESSELGEFQERKHLLSFVSVGGARMISQAVDADADLEKLDFNWRLWDLNGFVMQTFVNMVGALTAQQQGAGAAPGGPSAGTP